MYIISFAKVRCILLVSYCNSTFSSATESIYFCYPDILSFFWPPKLVAACAKLRSFGERRLVVCYYNDVSLPSIIITNKLKPIQHFWPVFAYMITIALCVCVLGALARAATSPRSVNRRVFFRTTLFNYLQEIICISWSNCPNKTPVHRHLLPISSSHSYILV